MWSVVLGRDKNWKLREHPALLRKNLRWALQWTRDYPELSRKNKVGRGGKKLYYEALDLLKQWETIKGLCHGENASTWVCAFTANSNLPWYQDVVSMVNVTDGTQLTQHQKIHIGLCRGSFWYWLTGARDILGKHRELLGDAWDYLGVRTQDEQGKAGEEVKPFPDKLYMRTLSDLADAHPKMAIMKSRKVMATWWAASRALHSAMFFPAREWICQCKKESESDERILERAWFMYKSLPKWVQKHIPALRLKCQIQFPSVGSRLLAVAQGPDPWRAPTASGGIIDEAAHMEMFADTLRAALPALVGPSGNMPLYVISSPNGKEHFYRLVEDLQGDELVAEEREAVQGQIKGMTWKAGRNGFLGVKLHISADEDKDPERTEAGKEYAALLKKLYAQDPLGYAREIDMSTDTMSGKPVFALQFHRDVNVTDKLEYIHSRPVYRGIDFGFIRPAVVWAYENEQRQLCVTHEALGKDEDVESFFRTVMDYSRRWFPQASTFIDFADPSGWNRSDMQSEKSRVEILYSLGIKPSRGEVKEKARVDTVRRLILPRTDGKPGLLVHPRCRILIDGFVGAYTYKDPPAGMTEFPKEQINKDGLYDHLQDALAYLCTGLRMVTGKEKNVKRRLPPPDESLNERTGW